MNLCPDFRYQKKLPLEPTIILIYCIKYTYFEFGKIDYILHIIQIISFFTFIIYNTMLIKSVGSIGTYYIHIPGRYIYKMKKGRGN